MTGGEARSPVVCLPFAGAGASFFRAWQDKSPASIHIIPVQLPGREDRVDEEPYTDVAEAADDLASEVLGLGRDLPRVGLFGHSLGAVLAYEVARRLAGNLDPASIQLIVSGCPGPLNQRTMHATGLPDADFLEKVRDLAGYSHPALADGPMRELLMQAIRADVAMHETYQPGPITPLALHVSTVLGSDDHLVSADDAATWRTVTTLPLAQVELPGGHMYLAESPGPLLRVIQAALDGPQT